MRPIPILIAAAMIMAVLATLISFSRIEAHTGSADCFAVACPGTGKAIVRSHDALSGGCADGDLHVMRYIPSDASVPLVATWCD